MNNTILIECNNLASQKTQIYQENNFLEGDTFKEKIFNHRWKTKLPQQITLQPGDQISLEKAMINSRGQSDETIELTGQAFTENFKDNEVELEFGYYLNNNMDFNLTLPKNNLRDISENVDILGYYNNTSKTKKFSVLSQEVDVASTEPSNPDIDQGFWKHQKTQVKHKGTHLVSELKESFYNVNFPQLNDFYVNSGDAFLIKYGSPSFRGKQKDYDFDFGDGSIVKLTQHAPIVNQGYNFTEHTTGHILLNKPDANTRFYIGKRDFRGFYEDDNFDIKKARTKIKLDEGFNNPVVLSKEITNQFHKQTTDEFCEPFEKFNFISTRRQENIADSSMKVQTTFSGNIFLGQQEDNDKYKFLLPKQIPANEGENYDSTYPPKKPFPFATQQNCEDVFWNQLLVGDIKRSIAISKFYGGITSINSVDLHFNDDYIADNLNILSGEEDVPVSVKKNAEYNHDEAPFKFGIQPVIFDNLASFSTTITEEERTDPKNSYWNTSTVQKTILDKEDLVYLGSSSTKLNLQDGDCIPTNMIANEDNFNRIKELFRLMEKPSDNELEMNYNNQEFKDSLDFYLEYNRLDDKATHFIHQLVAQSYKGSPSDVGAVFQPDTATLQRNGFPRLYNLPAPINTIQPASHPNYGTIEGKDRMPVLLGQYLNFKEGLNLDFLREEIGSDNLKVDKIDPVSINTYSRYNPNRTPIKQTLRLPTNAFSFTDTNGNYYDDEEIKKLDIGIVVAYKNVRSSTLIEETRVGAESTDRNVESITTTDTLPFGLTDKLVGGGAYKPYGQEEQIYGLGKDDPIEQKKVHKIQPLDFTGQNLDTLYRIDNGVKAQSTSFNSFLSDNTTDFVAIDTVDGNALSASNAIRVKITIPSAIDLNQSMGAMITHIRLYVAYDTNNDIDGSDYGMTVPVNMLGLPTKVIIRGDQTSDIGVFNTLLAETDLKDRYLQKANNRNLGSTFSANVHSQNLAQPNTNLSQQLDSLKPYIELDIRNANNYHHFLNEIELEFTENSNSKFQQRITIKRIEFMAYNTTEQVENIRNDILVHTDGYDNLKLSTTDNLKDNTLNNEYQIKHQSTSGTGGDSSIYGFDILREKYPSNNNLEDINITNDELSIELRNPYEVGDQVDYIIAGMGKQLNEVESIEPVLFYGGLNAYPSEIETLPHPTLPYSNSKAVFDNVLAYTTSTTVDPYRYRSTTSYSLPHYINFSNNQLKDKKLKVQKIKLYQSAYKQASTGNQPVLWVDEQAKMPKIFAIFGSNTKPDDNQKCAFGMNLLFCTATDYDQFLSSLTLSAGVDTTSTLTGFTNNDPDYPPLLTTNTSSNYVYNFTRSGIIILNDNVDGLGVEFNIPVSRQAEYRYYRILLFDNFTTQKEFRIGNLSIFGARKHDLGLRSIMPSSMPTTTFDTRSVIDYSPQIWINALGSKDMNKDLANGYGLVRCHGMYITGAGMNTSIVPPDSVIQTATQDSDGDYYMLIGDNSGYNNNIMPMLGRSSSHKYTENASVGAMNSGGSYTIIAWIDMPVNNTSSTVYTEHYYNQRRHQWKVLNDGRLNLTMYNYRGSTADVVGSFSTTTNGQFHGKYKLTIERYSGTPSTSYYKIYKDDTLVYTNNSDYKTYYYGKASSSFCIGCRTTDGNFNPYNAGIADNDQWRLYGIATFNHAMPLSVSSQITEQMLAQPVAPMHREIQTSLNQTYNDAYKFDLNNLLSNDLTKPSRINLGSQTDCILYFDLQSAQTLKYLDIFPSDSQASNFPETFNVFAGNNSDFTSTTNIGNLYITGSYTPNPQAEYVSDEDNLNKYRINLSQATPYRYLILTMTGILGLTSGNKDSNYVEFAGLRIIGNKTLISDDLSVYNNFYGIHNITDGHQTGTIDKFVNGKNNFPNNCLSFKYQFSNDPSADNEDYILENGWKFFDYDILGKGLSFNLTVDLQDSKSLGNITMFFQQNAQFFYPQICDIVGSNDPNFGTETSIHAISGISLTTGSTEYTRNNILTALFEQFLEQYNDKGSLRYLKFKFQSPKTNHLVELPVNKAGGSLGFTTGFTAYSSATYSNFNNISLLSNGNNLAAGNQSSIFVLDSSSGGFIGYEFTSAFEPTEYRLWTRNGNQSSYTNQYPISWELRASVSKLAYDLGTYDVLHTVSNTQWIEHTFTNYTPDDRKDISKGSYINTKNKYRYYVIYVVSNNGSTITSFSEFAIYGKTTGVSPKYKLLNTGDLRLGDMEVSEFKGKAYENLNQTDNYIEMIYTAHRSLQMNKYALYPNHQNATSSASTQNNFKFLKSWKFYGSNDYRALVENNDSYWTEIHDKTNTNAISSYDGNYTAQNISNSLLDVSGNPEPITIFYKYYKWRMYDRYENFALPNTTTNTNPSINLGELRIDELDRLQGGEQTDLIHQTVNANLSYPYTPSRGTIKSLVNDFGDIFGTSSTVGEGKFTIHFEEEIILTSLDVWGSPNTLSNPLSLILYRIDENGVEHLMGTLDNGTNVPTDFLESDEPSQFPQYAFNVPIPTSQQTIPSYKYAIDMGDGTELIQIQFNGKRQEYNLLGSLQQNALNTTITSSSGSNLSNLTNNTINDVVDSFQFTLTDEDRVIKIDFGNQVRMTRYGFAFNDTTQNYLSRWAIYGSNDANTDTSIPDTAILIDDKTDQEYSVVSHNTDVLTFSENLDRGNYYKTTNTNYYRYYYLKCVDFALPQTTLYISEFIMYGNENYDITNIIDDKLGETDVSNITDCYTYKKSGAGDITSIVIELKESTEINKAQIWKQMNGAGDSHTNAPSHFRIFGLLDHQLPYNPNNLALYDTLLTETNATYQDYTGTDLLDASDNKNYATSFSFNSALKKYKAYVFVIDNNLLSTSQEFVAISEIALYRGTQVSRDDVPFICFVSKQKQDHNGGLQLTPCVGEMIGLSRSMQNNKWGHIFTTKPVDLGTTLATGLSAYLNGRVDYPRNVFQNDDPKMYSPFIMIGSENMNMSFDTDLARLSIKEMNTALQQGQALSGRLRYEDYRTAITDADIQKKDSEANTQVSKINPRKYSVNSCKYGTTYEYDHDNLIHYRFPYNVKKIFPSSVEIPPVKVIYENNSQGEGVFTSQTGVGLLDMYVGKKDGSYHKLTLDNQYEYKNTLFHKLGYELDQLIPKFGNQNVYYNRFSQNEYINDEKNNLNKSLQVVSPLTTNGYLNATINTALDSATSWGFQMGKLGSVAMQTINTSYEPDELIAKNKPSKYDYSHILLYSDICPKNDYIGTNQSLAIPCLTHLDRQYTAGNFLFAEASSFRYTVDLPQTISEINIDLRLADGRPAPIDENSTIIFRIDKRRPAPLQLINQTSQK